MKSRRKGRSALEKNFRSFAEGIPVRQKEQPVTAVQEDYSQYTDALKETIGDRKELAERLGRLVAEIGDEYSSPGKKSFADMQRLAEQEAAIRLVGKRILRLTNHIKNYIDYFYSDPCPSDDPLTWGN